MTRLLLVRHARPSANWDRDLDAGLDDVGVEEAQALVGALGPAGPLRIVTSPMRRTRETAAPLAAHWGTEPIVESAVSEIPSPGDDLTARRAWLREMLGARWRDLPPGLQDWRGALIEALVAIPEPAVVVSHYMAINVAVGAATDDDRLICFAPGHASVTELAVEDGRLRLVALGDEATTVIS